MELPRGNRSIGRSRSIIGKPVLHDFFVQAGKVSQIGFLGSGTPTGWGRFGLEAIRLGLKDHGYVPVVELLE
jgi:hypothetical protein